MPEFRAALVMVPPLLADLIIATATARLARAGVQLSIFSVPAVVTRPATASGFIAADVAILGPDSAASAIAAALFPPAIPTLTLSADLTRLLGPLPGDNLAFTPEILAQLLRDLAERI